MQKLKLVLFLSILFIITARPLEATTYYIDFATGSDSNDGTAKVNPWKHAPGMQGCAVNCSAKTPTAGDNFIFKGGVTWDRTNWQWVISGSGSAGNPIYYGVDPTWYTGASWSRPIFDFGGSSGKICTSMIGLSPISYNVLDNFEFTHLYWDHTCNDIPNGVVAYVQERTNNNEIKNIYAHGWSHEAWSPNSTQDNCALIAGSTQGDDTASSIHDSVFDGSDVDNSLGYSCVAVWGAPPIQYNNYYSHLANGSVTNYPLSFYQNTCDTLGTSYDLSPQHTQCYESNTDRGVLFYNNLIQHVQTGLDVNISPQPGFTAYVFNNVIWDVQDNNNTLDFSYPANTTSGGSGVAFNNTIEAGTDGSNPGSIVTHCLPNLQSCKFQNNHIISAANNTAACTGTCTQDHNIFQTRAQANSQGYVGSSTYPFSPPPGGSTVAAGANLTSSCTGNLTSLCSTSSVGVRYNATNHTVIVPNATPMSRPSAWDIGAYQSYAPLPANSGVIASSNVSSSSLTLNWTKATDPVTAQSALQYEVLLSTNNNIFSLGNAQANGTIIQAYTADIATFNVTGLASGTTYYFNVIVTDQAGNQAVYVMTSATTLGLLVSPATLSAGAVGIPYSQGITASGTGPYTFSILTGALPAGLTLNTSTGVLSGTPSSNGAANFTVQVVDSLARSGQRPYRLGIAGADSNNIALVRTSMSYNSAPTPGFVGTYAIVISISNMGPALDNPIFFKVIGLDKSAPDLNPAQPDKLLTADNGAGVAGDVQSLSVSGLPSGASTTVTFQIGLGSRQQFTFVADLYGLLVGTPVRADETIVNVKAGAVGPIGPRLLKRVTFRVPESVSPIMSGKSVSDAIPPASNVGVITGPGSRSRSAVAIDPILPSRMAIAANDTRGNVIVSTTEDGGSTWRPTMMSRSLGGLDFFNAQDPSLAFDSLGRLSVVYVLSNMIDAANATVITESADGVNFNPPFAISFHSAEKNVIDSRPVIAIGSGGRYVAWENFGSRINVVRSEPGGIFGPPVTVVSAAQVSSPAIAMGKSAVYIGWDEWGFNSLPPYHTGGRLMMASSPHREQLRFSGPLQITTTNIGFSSLRIPMLPAPLGVSTNLNLAVDPRSEKLLYSAFVDKQDGLAIRFARSFDGGRTWTVMTLENCAGGGDQFSPALNLDLDGHVYISFYDTLKVGADTAHLFLATSSEADSFEWQEASDGCKEKPSAAEFVFNSRTSNTNWFKTSKPMRFAYLQITTVPIDESKKNLGSEIVTNLGDRTAIAASSDNILIAWTDTRERKENIYLSILSVRH